MSVSVGYEGTVEITSEKMGNDTGRGKCKGTHDREAGKVGRYKDGQGEGDKKGRISKCIYTIMHKCINTYIQLGMNVLQTLYNWILLLGQF